MKKRFLTLLTGLLATLTIFSQQWASSNEPPSIRSVNYASRLAAEILDAAGLQANFRISESDVPNAMAVVYQGNRYILYNPNFIDLLNRATGTRWAAVSVLAHEIGHHLYPTSSGRELATELEADQFSGFVLRKMGATLEEAQAAMMVLGTEHATETHPAARDRLAQIARGWSLAGGSTQRNNVYREDDEEEEETVVSRNRTPSQRETILSSNQILATLTFNADRQNEYYVTRNLDVVKYDGVKLTVIGKLAQRDSYEYPYLIYDSYGYTVYVHRQGNLVNNRGEALGSITVRS